MPRRRVLGSLSPLHRAMHAVVAWHRWLGARDLGRPVTGVCNLALLGLALTGLVLWWPRRWNAAALRARPSPTSGVRARSRGIATAVWRWSGSDGSMRREQRTRRRWRCARTTRDTRLRLALMLHAAGRRDAAMPHLETLARAGSDAPEVWLALARAYYERTDYAASERAFARAAKLRDDGRTWFNLGVVRLRLENPTGAREAFERAARHEAVREPATRELDKLRDAGGRQP